jgi:hypothetical protein
MSDSSGGFGQGTDATQTGAGQANQAREGFGALRGPRSERDVSRPPASTIKRGSSTTDQAARGQL